MFRFCDIYNFTGWPRDPAATTLAAMFPFYLDMLIMWLSFPLSVRLFVPCLRFSGNGKAIETYNLLKAWNEEANLRS